MALTVEDGTGVAGANSYASLATLRAYASARGVTLPADDAALEAFALLGMDYLEGLRGRYQGAKTDPTQPLQWPRYPVVIDGADFPSDAIPVELVNALCRLCIEQHAGVDLSPTRTGAFIIEDTTGPITTKYSEKLGGGAGSPPDMPAVDALLSPLLTVGRVGIAFTRV